MERGIKLLVITAASLGFIHTVFGPDHYLPFIFIARARRWALRKTLLISFFCGLGHVMSSVVLGFVGIALGIAVSRLEDLESFRGQAASWLLIGFGFTYFVWGLRHAIRNKPHKHLHLHLDGLEHDHLHTHQDEHLHFHLQEEKKSITPWVLFTIFVFGPCEPLIPLVMYPASKHNTAGLIMVTTAFGVVTILTMLTIILISSWGIGLINLGKAERYVHIMAGAMIFLSGLGVRFLGL